MMRWLGLLGREGIPIRLNPENAPEATPEQAASMRRVPSERPSQPPAGHKALAVVELAKAAQLAAEVASGKRRYETPTLETRGNARDVARASGSQRDEPRRRKWR